MSFGYRRWLFGLFVFNVLVLGASAVMMLRAQSAPANGAAALPYHGYLELAGVPVEGKKAVTFTLYNGDSTPTTWNERQTVVIAGGHFSAMLGAQTPLDEVLKGGVAPLSVGVSVQDVGSDGLPTGTAVALAGRQLLGSTPYAWRGAPGTSFIADSDITSVGGRVYDRSGPVMPVGAILAYGGEQPPAGWLACDGRAVSRSTYAPLFAAIGSQWGPGDGTATFNLPDLRGRAPIGAGQGSGLTNRSLAQQVGTETHTLTVSEMPSHGHSIPMQQSNTNDGAGGGNRVLTGNNNFTTGGTGGGQPHNNMPPSAVVNYIIKV
jgi:microcystin-dependent protein